MNKLYNNNATLANYIFITNYSTYKVKSKTMKNNHSKIARKIKINIIQKHTKAISKSFKRKGELDKSFIRKEYRICIGNDECHRRNAGGWNWYGSRDVNPMFTSRNSHKQTNHK